MGIEISPLFRIRHDHSQERTMAGTDSIRMTLTPEQKEQIRRATGKETDTLELTVEELEERIAPVTLKRGS